MFELPTLALALALVFTGPKIVRKGQTAHNYAFSVVLPPDEVTESQHQSPAGRKAQEVAEWRLLWLVAIALAAPALFLLPSFYGLLVFPIAALLGKNIVDRATNHFDYVGHGVEIMVAEDERRAGYREAEIARMLRDPKRKGMTAAEVDRKLRRWNWLARIGRVLS